MSRATEEDSQNPLWTKADFARAVPFSGLPESLQAKLRVIQDNARAEGLHKVPVQLRLSEEVVRALKAAGGDMSTKVDEILKERLVA